MPELKGWLCQPLSLAGDNSTLLDIVIPFVLDSMDTYCLTCDDLALIGALI